MSITAADEWEYSDVGDVNFSNVDVFGFFTGGAANGGFVSESNTETEFLFQEFGIASPQYHKYEYVVGLYYAEAETDRTFPRNLGLPLIPPDWLGTAATESMAEFGQATWRFNDATSITAGLRFNKEEISVDYVNNLADPVTPLSEDTMLYARYAQGYKGQAYDITTSFDQFRLDNPDAPETSDSYEIGIKSTLLEGRLQFNTAVFFTEYEDYQAQSTVVLPDGGVTATLNNVGSLETQGLGLEGIALLGENLSLIFAAAYIDATIEEFNGADCYGGQTARAGRGDLWPSLEPWNNTRQLRGYGAKLRHY